VILPEGVQMTKGARKKIKEAHNKWINYLTMMIKRESRCVLDKNGNLKHLLPTKLIRHVWETMIRERMDYERSRDDGISDEEALALAHESIVIESDKSLALQKAQEILFNHMMKKREEAQARKEAENGESDGADQSDAGSSEQAADGAGDGPAGPTD
jgi:hypothetical protein